MTLPDFLRRVVGILDSEGIPFMLTGSLAAALYGSPRATQDIDFVIEVAAEDVDRLVDRFLAKGYYVSREAAHQAVTVRGQFNVIDPELGWKVDLIVRKDRPFSIEEFSRRRSGTLLGAEVPVTSLEDLIVIKLEWVRLGDSEMQLRDVVHLLDSQWDSLDRAHVEGWVERLGLTEEWKEALRRGAPGEGDSLA